MKTKAIHIFLFFVIIALTTCKKYPENTLWFTNFSKIKFLDNVHLTAFTVNGIDSLQSLKVFFGSRSGYKDISQVYIEETYDSHYGNTVGVFHVPYEHIILGYSFSKNKKNISFGFVTQDTSILKRNLFIDNNQWQIIKLDLKTGTRKIKKTVNGNTYELQFEKL